MSLAMMMILMRAKSVLMRILTKTFLCQTTSTKAATSLEITKSTAMQISLKETKTFRKEMLETPKASVINVKEVFDTLILTQPDEIL